MLAGTALPFPGAAQTHANIQQSSEFRKRASGIGAGIQQTAQNLLKLQQLIKRTGLQLGVLLACPQTIQQRINGMGIVLPPSEWDNPGFLQHM